MKCFQKRSSPAVRRVDPQAHRAEEGLGRRRRDRRHRRLRRAADALPAAVAPHAPLATDHRQHGHGPSPLQHYAHPERTRQPC